MITNIQKSLGKLLARTAAQAKLKRMKRTLTRSTRIIYTNEEVGKDETKETALLEEQGQHYEEVMNKLYESLQLYTD